MYLPKPTESADFTPAPAGTFIARCYRFVDLGTHTSEFNGDRKTRREVMLSWELSDEFMQDGKPYTINKRYTWSMHEKSTLRLHLEAWRGQPFKADDFDGPNRFNIKNIIGKPCTLTIVHKENKEGKVSASVSGVGKMMKGVQAMAPHNPEVYLALTPEDFDAAAYGNLSDYYKQHIASSPEYQEIFRANARHDDPGLPEQRDGEVFEEAPF